jgi:hypothetical protein
MGGLALRSMPQAAFGMLAVFGLLAVGILFGPLALFWSNTKKQ